MQGNINKIGIIGLGLIGGSLAKDLKSRNVATSLIGHDRNHAHQARALQLNIVQEIGNLDTVLKDAGIIILSVPVNALVKLVPKVLDRIQDQIVIEVGSTKKKLLDAISDHPKRKNLISMHPMAGTEFTGPDAAIYHLFEKKCCVICDAKDSDEKKLLIAKNIFERVGMYVIEMESGDHDLHAAYVSHISHVTSFALAQTVLEKEKNESRIFEMASGGFSSTVRLAKSAPSMWTPIFIQNKENVLDVLDEHIHQLMYFKECLKSGNEEALNTWMARANQIRKIIK
jgi:prephenate dehydrogenase